MADEILARGGPWSLNGARFLPREDSEMGVSIALFGEEICSELALDRRPFRGRSREAAALKRTGYEILSIRSKPFHARRRLRGLRELDAEVGRLIALSRNPSELALFPPRVPRRPGLPEGKGTLSKAAFDCLRDTHGWTPEYVSVFRRGEATVIEAPDWSIGALCLFFADKYERWIDLHLQLSRKRSNKTNASTDFAKVHRTMRSRLAPLGYRTLSFRGRNIPPNFAMFEKRVSTLSEARRERSRLDRVLFGD